MNAAIVFFIVSIICIFLGITLFGVYLIKKGHERTTRLEILSIQLRSLFIENGYHVTSEVDGLFVDENNRVWGAKGISHIFKYEDIVSIDYIENGISQDPFSVLQSYHKELSYISINVNVRNYSSSYIKFLLYSGTPISRNSLSYSNVIALRQKYFALFRTMISTDTKNNNSTQYYQYNKPPAEKSTKITYSKIEGAPSDYIVFDLETTGLDCKNSDILEIGAIKYINDVEARRFHTYIKTNKTIPQKITDINGITNETVKDAPSARNALKEFISFIEKYPLIAYNSDFDMSFLQHNCQKKLNITIDNDVIDALPLARKFLPGLPNKKLETVKQHFELNVGSHNAIDDCIVTNHLYQYCKQFEAKKYKYDIPFSYNPVDLSDIELEYLSVIIAICEKNGISKKQLSMHPSGTLLVIELGENTLVSLKLSGRLQYVLLEIPFESFSEKYSTDLKVTAGVKSEGNTTRVFTDSADQLWELEQLIAKKQKRVWSKS